LNCIQQVLGFTYLLSGRIIFLQFEGVLQAFTPFMPKRIPSEKLPEQNMAKRNALQTTS
jgi:hypothetical protein